MSEGHWEFFIPFGDEVSLLQLGSGAAARGLGLARRCGRVETLCFSEEQTRDVAEKARTAGLDNLHAHLHRPGERLDFADGAFDALLIDRLLNYPVSYDGETDPGPASSRLLSEARRVLADGGVLCAGAENRMHHALGLSAVIDSLRKSTPGVDHGLEADLKALGDSRRKHRRTLGGYRRLFRSAGFRSVRAFAPLPDGVRPEVVVSLDEREPQGFLFRDRVRRHSAKTRTAAALGGAAVAIGVLPRVVPFYFLVASK